MYFKYILFFQFSFCHFVLIAQPISYSTHVKPIIEQHCLPCHLNKNIGTMPLTNYKEVSTYAKMVEFVTQKKIMPPWKADEEYAKLKGTKHLTDKQLLIIKQWIENGTKNNSDKKNLIDVPTKAIKTIYKPDTIFAMQKIFYQREDFIERSQAFVIPFSFKEDKYVEAIEFVAGNKKIVKSCNISIDTSNQSQLFDSYDLSYGYNSPVGISFVPHQYIWYQWTADMQGATFYESPYLKKMPIYGKLVLHITYAASTSKQKDSSYVKIKWGKQNIHTKIINSSILFNTKTLTNGPFTINVDEKRRFYSEKTVVNEIEIISVMPMGQYACNSWEIYAIDTITGIRKNILYIPNWDAHWKKKYDLEKPIRLSKTFKIYGTTYYNNSEENPSLIILPPKKISYGESERDEMYLVQYDVVDLENDK